MEEKIGACILAAGRGSRTGLDIPKQFLLFSGKPLFLYSVEAFLPYADVITVVTGKDSIAVCEKILADAGLSARVNVIPGGAERWQSSYNGIMSMKNEGASIVLIHDAARALVTGDVIARCIETVGQYGSAVAAVPSKDTIKVAGPDGRVRETPDRSLLWAVQTPQGFRTAEICEAYEVFLEKIAEGEDSLAVGVTDDAMVMERFSDRPVQLFTGDYGNIKLTTEEDIALFEKRLNSR